MQWKTWIIRLTAFLAVGLFTLLCSLPCLRASGPSPKIVTIKDADECGIKEYEPVEEGQPLNMLLPDPFYNGETQFYLNSYGRHPSARCEENRLILNGKTVWIHLSKNNDSWQWLEKATAKDLRAIRSVKLSTEMDDKERALLKRLSEQNPKLDSLIINTSDWQQVLALFDPETLIMDDETLEAGDTPILAGQKRIKNLFVQKLEDPSLLPQMKGIEKLMIRNWDPEELGAFPKNLPKLKSLAIGLKEKNLLSLTEQPNLEELLIPGSSDIDLSLLSNFPKLRYFSLSEGVKNLTPLKRLKHLKWLGFCPGDTQQLVEIVKDHPALVGLMLCPEENVDLTELKNLRQLEYLFIIMKSNDPAPLYEMKQLKWLAVAEDTSKKEEPKANLATKLQKALPGTAVARFDICLGSGWILLLAPAIGLVWLIEKRRHRHVYAADAKDDRT